MGETFDERTIYTTLTTYVVSMEKYYEKVGRKNFDELLVIHQKCHTIPPSNFYTVFYMLHTNSCKS